MALDETRAAAEVALKALDTSKARSISALTKAADAWFEDYKKWEEADTFESARSGNRLIFRCIKTTAIGEKTKIEGVVKISGFLGIINNKEIGSFRQKEEEEELSEKMKGELAYREDKNYRKPDTSHHGSRKETRVEDRKMGFTHPMNISKGLEGYKMRSDPQNFVRLVGRDPHADEIEGVNKKNEKGLHDQSWSLLNKDRPFNTQLWHKMNTELYIFASAALPADNKLMLELIDASKLTLRAASAFCKSDGLALYSAIRKMQRKFTRIKKASASDFGSYYLDITGGVGSKRKWRYGATQDRRDSSNKVIGELSNEQFVELSQIPRKNYQDILVGQKQDVHNEISVAIREHNSPQFPVVVSFDPQAGNGTVSSQRFIDKAGSMDNYCRITWS